MGDRGEFGAAGQVELLLLSHQETVGQIRR